MEAIMHRCLVLQITIFLVNLLSVNSRNHVTCGDILEFTAPEGQILSPGYPSSYPANVSCTWTVTLKDGQIIAFYINDLDLPPATGEEETCTTYLSISEEDGEIYRGCGNGSSALSTYTHKATVVFHADGASQQRSYSGFNLTYLALGCPDVTKTSEFQRIEYDYNEQGHRTVQIQCATGKTVNSTCAGNTWEPAIDELANACRATAQTTSSTTASSGTHNGPTDKSRYLVVVFSFLYILLRLS